MARTVLIASVLATFSCILGLAVTNGFALTQSVKGVEFDTEDLDRAVEVGEALDKAGQKDAFRHTLPTSESGVVVLIHYLTTGWSVKWHSNTDSKRQIVFLEGAKRDEAINYFERLEKGLTGKRGNTCHVKCGKFTRTFCNIRCPSSKTPYCYCELAGVSKSGEQSYCKCVEK